MDDEIAYVFKNGDYKRALDLLPNARDFKYLESLWFYPQKYKCVTYNTYNVTLLHLAAYHGWLDICDQLITEYKYSPSVRYSFKSLTGHSTPFYDCFPPPPLFYAILGGHYEIVTYLINKCNCDPHQQSEEGETPLYLACSAGHYDIVTYLINECHCDPNTGVSYNPLHGACIGGNLKIVRLLPSKDVNIQDKDGYTPLHTACHFANLDIVKFLVSFPSVDVNSKASFGYTPLHMACSYNNLDVVKFLVSLFSVDVNIKDDDGHTPLHTACRYGHLDIAEFLVSLSSVDVNSKASGGYTPLHTACRYGNLDIVKFILSLSSVDLNIRVPGNPVLLHKACCSGTVDVVKFLVYSSSVDVNSKYKASGGYTPLHTACRYANLDIVKFLVSLSSVDVNSKASFGYTPLHTACSYNNLDAVKFLVSLFSVDINIKDDDGHTPLHTACCFGNLETIAFLVSLSSVDVNSKASDGCAPLHTACQYRKLNIVKFLMSTAQVNPISTTIDGDTPLHIACKHGKVDIVKYLLSTGRMDPMAKNRYKKTPVQMGGDKYHILKLFEPFKQCRVDFPVESYSKVFLCGNTTNGKSSLAHALLQRVNGVHISWIDRYSPFKRHEQAEPLTAGIVPHHLQSDEVGNIVLYDFAGHPEYYSSHEAVLENLMLRSPAVFIILVKLTDKMEDIEKQLYYWASFIQNVCSRVSKKSQVIVVGSHADKWRAMNGKDLVKRIDLQKIIAHQEYKGFLSLDCHNLNETNFSEFIRLLTESTTASVDRSDSISFYCHVLYAFLKSKLAGQVAMTLANLLQSLYIY